MEQGARAGPAAAACPPGEPRFAGLAARGRAPGGPEERLLGPYCYTDGHFWWDRDCWKYTAKYHVRLPQEFVDYVMSGEGDGFLESHAPDDSSWFNRIENNYGDTPHGNFLPKMLGTWIWRISKRSGAMPCIRPTMASRTPDL